MGARSGIVGLREAVEDRLAMGLAHARSGVGHGEAHDLRPRAGLDGDAHRSGFGEFHRVAGQIDQDLADALLIADPAAGQARVDRGVERQPLALGLGRDGAARRVQHLGEIERGGIELQAPGFDARDVEHVLDDGQERAAGLLQRGEIAALARVQVRAREQLGHAHDPVERRADLVAHIGQEARLGFVGGLGGLAALLQKTLVRLALGDVLEGAAHGHRAALRVALYHPAEGLGPDRTAVGVEVARFDDVAVRAPGHVFEDRRDDAVAVVLMDVRGVFRAVHLDVRIAPAQHRNALGGKVDAVLQRAVGPNAHVGRLGGRLQPCFAFLQRSARGLEGFGALHVFGHVLERAGELGRRPVRAGNRPSGRAHPDAALLRRDQREGDRPGLAGLHAAFDGLFDFMAALGRVEADRAFQIRREGVVDFMDAPRARVPAHGLGGEIQLPAADAGKLRGLVQALMRLLKPRAQAQRLGDVRGGEIHDSIRPRSRFPFDMQMRARRRTAAVDEAANLLIVLKLRQRVLGRLMVVRVHEVEHARAFQLFQRVAERARPGLAQTQETPIPARRAQQNGGEVEKACRPVPIARRNGGLRRYGHGRAPVCTGIIIPSTCLRSGYTEESPCQR